MINNYLRYPDKTEKRKAEGGTRLNKSNHKSSHSLPLVTVITVCFNAAATLRQCLTSVLNQTYPNIEYIIVDGNSSDNTLEIIHNHADQIDYFISEPDGGIYHAMNKGIELSTGDYIIFLNADDWYEHNAIEELVNLSINSKYDFVSSLANYVDNHGKFIRIQPPSPFDPGVELRMPLRHETMLIPKWIYQKCGLYDISYRIIADRIFTARLFWLGYTHGILLKPLLNFRTSGTSSVDLGNLFTERERAINNRFPGLTLAAVNDLVHLESITLDRLCEISNTYRSAEFRETATAYALDRETQGHKEWQDIDIDAFSPVLKKRPVRNPDSASRRKAQASKKPKVSIVLPIYNAEDSLRECLDSILSQTLSDLEVICINDQSPDQSQAIIVEYANKDNRIKSRMNEINVGLGTSRNRGIKLAQGEYIFHIDPDDVIPPNALEVLVKIADTHQSDIVRGAFLHEQYLMGQKSNLVRKGIPENSNSIINTTLEKTPELLRSTEGHWSYLYKSDFAKRIFYPEDLKMGQDSIFLVHVLTKARSITIIPDVIYHYRANAKSAMNMFNFRKYIDEIEWRFRAWKVLTNNNQLELAEHLLFNYWNIPFFQTLEQSFTLPQKQQFFRKLFYAFNASGNSNLSKTNNTALRKVFTDGFNQFVKVPTSKSDSGETLLTTADRLKIDILTTSDHGGAGLAALRCTQGLRACGHDVKMLSLLTKSQTSYVWKLPLMEQFHNNSMCDDSLRTAWRQHAVLTHNEQKSLRARELFSKIGNIVDTDTLTWVLDDTDVVHLHWVSGILNYERLHEMIGDKPVVWTLHDMNPFTGGCHYSEGCTGYKNECNNCPLVDGKTDMPHKAWKAKKKAYMKIKKLHIICPSQWLVNRARESSLLGDRPIHIVPNIFPAQEFRPVNKIVARHLLGLPLNKQLIVFGADSLNNLRKGGDILKASLQTFAKENNIEDVEGIFFGSGKLDLAINTHNMGYVNDPKKLSQIYAAADIFAFPSREDNAPQTLIEAMLSGTPVVAFPVGNVPDLIEHMDTGYIAKYEDPVDFAKGIKWALDSSNFGAKLKRGLNAHLKAKHHNNVNIAINKHIEIYRKIIS